MRKSKAAQFCNLFIGLMSIGSWLFMAVFTIEGSTLAVNGLGSLKFFTVLSNLYNGVVCLVYARWIHRKIEITEKMRLLKLTGTTVVTLTFLTVMVFLGPLYGYGSMFLGSNLWMHLVLPLMSIGSYLFLEEGRSISSRTLRWTVCPTLLYEIGYLTNIAIQGIGEWPDRHDFYGFLSWGYGVGAVIAIVILLVTWGIAWGLQRMSYH